MQHRQGQRTQKGNRKPRIAAAERKEDLGAGSQVHRASVMARGGSSTAVGDDRVKACRPGLRRPSTGVPSATATACFTPARFVSARGVKRRRHHSYRNMDRNSIEPIPGCLVKDRIKDLCQLNLVSRLMTDWTPSE